MGLGREQGKGKQSQDGLESLATPGLPHCAAFLLYSSQKLSGAPCHLRGGGSGGVGEATGLWTVLRGPASD